MVLWSIVLGVCVCVCVCGVGGGGGGGRGGYFNYSWVGMYRWYPETQSSAEFCYPILVQTSKISPYPRFAIFQKLLRSTLSLILSWVFIFWVSSPSFPSVESNLQSVDQFVENDTLFETQTLSFHTLSHSKLLENHTLHTVAHTHIALKWQYTTPWLLCFH